MGCNQSKTEDAIPITQNMHKAKLEAIKQNNIIKNEVRKEKVFDIMENYTEKYMNKVLKEKSKYGHIIRHKTLKWIISNLTIYDDYDCNNQENKSVIPSAPYYK